MYMQFIHICILAYIYIYFYALFHLVYTIYIYISMLFFIWFIIYVYIYIFLHSFSSGLYYFIPCGISAAFGELFQPVHIIAPLSLSPALAHIQICLPCWRPSNNLPTHFLSVPQPCNPFSKNSK